MSISFPLISRVSKLLNRIPAKYTLVIVILSFSLGKLQPFSTIPVYSHIPATAEYYYVTDENDSIIPIVTTFDFEGSNLHKMIEYKYLQHSDTYGDPEILSMVGAETLEYMFETANINSSTYPYKTIKIWNAKVTMVDKKIKVQSTEIAVKQVK